VSERQLLRALALVLLGVAVAPAVPIVVETIAFFLGHPFVVSAWERVVGPICHHWDWRTLHWHGAAAPVCARCTGLYLGYVAALPVLALGVVARDRSWLLGSIVFFAALWLFGFGAALGEKIDLFRTANVTRVALGATLGIPASGMLAVWTRAIAGAT
jgi:uncharacterized membrane protein